MKQKPCGPVANRQAALSAGVGLSDSSPDGQWGIRIGYGF